MIKKTARYKITFAYDGSNFAGMQVQPHQRTVEQVLTVAVNRIAKKPQPPVAVIASGRTDAKVHALGQVAHFDLPFEIEPVALLKALNSSLPLDVLVKKVEPVSFDFHARFSAHNKRYRYRVSQGEFVNPFKRDYTGHFKYPLDVAKMQLACQDFVGEHDFTSFVASGSNVKSHVRTIYSATVVPDNTQNEIVLEFSGSGFLYNQVRIMVAVLLEIGTGQRAVDDIPKILAGKDRQLARWTAPASGLYLVSVGYENNLHNTTKSIDEKGNLK
ncbi:tRNA pseudouridine(38-40) synthase TruA [Paucilactobacillus wasatchensis]|uniref:tRNA pseudouridine synthase A n=1 Tax=Paucilactobacillus wasatchensis TaxID=1335616 RepID=A0A0D0YV12_9LACO|nr:tRNA pseudouridine(38-40) synthase TruA [Paucilactobacillus wasatchensis]KIS03099.1 tRNA pseudouridine synthase A [Paucilactobacillus wasatchensis]